ncbi:MAG: RNA replicase [Alphaproteobacteria bacterium]|nr:RNA replicase [Alphaproteobacteria bacterium]MDE2043379.1 RNA replicase [Alphaproteobacteria bacterium]MDE2341679.1 RNA replicase [Alphaproteobacteria bacterium]
MRGFFRPFDSKTHGAILKAAERFENLTKRKGCRNGALGYVGIKVLKALLEFIDYRTGRLEPSYVALCKRAYLSVCAVAAALKRLAAHGFIEMIRRYEPTGNISGGPTVRQITNAYRVSLPAVAAKTLRTSPTAPVPDDERARRKEQRDERERMIAQLPEWEQPVARTNIADPSLAEILNRLGRAIYAASHPAVSL